MELTANNVETIFTASLFDDDADKSNAVIVEGIRAKFGFDPKKLEENKENISSMLDELPDEFKKNSGGGMRVFNAGMTKNGNQWGEHQNVEQLFCLGMAIGRVELLMPREMWQILPGGMPYYCVN